jgi:hypothetical protein
VESVALQQMWQQIVRSYLESKFHLSPYDLRQKHAVLLPIRDVENDVFLTLTKQQEYNSPNATCISPRMTGEKLFFLTSAKGIVTDTTDLVNIGQGRANERILGANRGV